MLLQDSNISNVYFKNIIFNLLASHLKEQTSGYQRNKVIKVLWARTIRQGHLNQSSKSFLTFHHVLTSTIGTQENQTAYVPERSPAYPSTHTRTPSTASLEKFWSCHKTSCPLTRIPFYCSIAWKFLWWILFNFQLLNRLLPRSG